MNIKKIIIVLFIIIYCFLLVQIAKKYYINNYNLGITPEEERINFIKNSTDLEISLNSKKIPILLYHHISKDVMNEMVVSPNNFESHMKALHDNGYYTLSIDDIVNYIEQGKDIPDKAVLITFDDGYYSNYEYAFPILKKYKLKATIFLIGSYFGTDMYKETSVEILPHFGFEEKLEMEQSGIIEFSCHTYDLHQEPFLEEQLKNSTIYENILRKADETRIEYKKRLINDCKKWENLFNQKIKSYSYPHGESNILSLTILKNYGVKVTFNTMARTDIIIKNNPISGYNLGRYTITEDYKAEDIINLIK